MLEDSEGISKGIALEGLIGYSFKNTVLRERAITRRAWFNEHGSGTSYTYPGLATLGDAVVSITVVNYYFSMGQTPEQITDEKNARVSRKNHTAIATRIGLKACLKLGKGEGNTKEWNEGTALGESFEEVVGAVYLDDIYHGGNGIDVCTKVLRLVGLIG